MNTPFDWRDMLRFDKMIAPTFLTILYYVQITISLLASLWFVMKGMDTPYGGGVMVMSGLIGLVLGPFIIRLFYELLIVIFKIHTRLSSIDYTLRGQSTGSLTNEAVGLSSVPSQPDPSGSVDNPVSAPYPAAEQTGFSRPVQQSTPAPAASQPIGFQLSTARSSTPSPTESSMPDFWNLTEPVPPSSDSSQAYNAAPSIELRNLGQKIPNWPAVAAVFILLYSVIRPYAVVDFEASSSFGQLEGLSYSIKNSSLGIVVILAILVMLGTSVGGIKWLWFVAGYSVAVLGSLIAFIDENSVFSQLSKARAAIGTAGEALNSLVPQADQFAQQAAQRVPGASHFLTTPFYLFLASMLFLGYWALAGKYQERGLMSTSGL